MGRRQPSHQRNPRTIKRRRGSLHVVTPPRSGKQETSTVLLKRVPPRSEPVYFGRTPTPPPSTPPPHPPQPTQAHTQTHARGWDKQHGRRAAHVFFCPTHDVSRRAHGYVHPGQAHRLQRALGRSFKVTACHADPPGTGAAGTNRIPHVLQMKNAE